MLAHPGVVLVLTNPDDLTAQAVVKELDVLGVRAVRLDPGDFPTELTLSAYIEPTRWGGGLAGGLASVDLTEIRAVYYRRPTRFRLPAGLSDGDRAFALAEARMGLGGVLTGLDVLWVNHPVRTGVAEYKPLGLRTAARVGLTIPRTLVTNDYQTAVGFAQTLQHGLVCKTLSSVVLSEDGVAKGVYATRISADQLVPEQVAVTAHLFQEWVPKAYDVRLTMVGTTAHAVAIHAGSASAYVDWRRDYGALRYEPVTVPEPVLAGARAYLTALGLVYGAFDFVVTPDGEWVFLECNPAGQFLWLEHESGLPIAASIANLLATGDAQ